MKLFLFFCFVFQVRCELLLYAIKRLLQQGIHKGSM